MRSWLPRYFQRPRGDRYRLFMYNRERTSHKKHLLRNLITPNSSNIIKF